MAQFIRVDTRGRLRRVSAPWPIAFRTVTTRSGKTCVFRYRMLAENVLRMEAIRDGHFRWRFDWLVVRRSRWKGLVRKHDGDPIRIPWVSDRLDERGNLRVRRVYSIYTRRLACEVHFNERRQVHGRVTIMDALSNRVQLEEERWLWQGIPVVEWLFERLENPELITVNDVVAVGNAELRTLLISRAGADRLMQSGSVLVSADVDEHGNRREVRAALGLQNEGLQLLVLLDSSRGTRAVLFVPLVDENGRAIRTPSHAVAWTFGLPPGSYRPVASS